MFSRAQKIRSLERYIYKKLGVRDNSANKVANVVGVLIDVKPSMEFDWPLEKTDEKTIRLLTKKIEALGLCVVTGGRRSDLQFFYLAKSQKRANALRDAFEELQNQGPSAEIHGKIGKMLGYPDTAVQYFIRLHPERGISDNHRATISRNRFYAHSMSHEEEEFATYEEPIYNYLRRNCPRTAKFYQENSDKRWLD